MSAAEHEHHPMITSHVLMISVAGDLHAGITMAAAPNGCWECESVAEWLRDLFPGANIDVLPVFPSDPALISAVTGLDYPKLPEGNL